MRLKNVPPKNKHEIKVQMLVNRQANLDKNNEKTLYNTTEGVCKWLKELTVDVGFEAKKMKMERTQMLSSEGYKYHWIKVHRQVC